VVDLSAGSRATINSNREIIMLSGSATASADQGAVTTIELPGGKAVLQGTKGAVTARMDVSANESRLSVSRGVVDLTSKDGTLLAVNRGDTASLSKVGALRVIDAVPTYFDVAFSVGESGQIHDPKGATAVKLLFSDKCNGNGDIEVDNDARFKTPKVSSGNGSANVMLPSGGWYYRLRCDGKIATSGRFLVVRDAGEQRLPAATPTNAVATDGRQYTMTYQSVVPNVSVEWKGASGSNFKLVVASGGKSTSYNSATAKGTIPGKGLREGQFSFWFEREDGLKSKVSTLNVVFEQNAVQVYIETPVNGRPFGNPVEVRGAALEGWKAFTSEGVPLKLDKQRRFAAQFPTPSGNALAIKLSHPKFGTHYYLRRGQ
jgi:hypothetical protein